jgi:hypothetical protein
MGCGNAKVRGWADRERYSELIRCGASDDPAVAQLHAAGLLLEQDDEGFGHDAVVGHRVGGCGGFHRSGEGVEISDVGDDRDVIRIFGDRRRCGCW